MFNDVMKNIISKHHVVGKEQMKKAAVVAIETKNDVMHREGFASSHWVLDKFSRRPGGLNEEAEWGQLVVLSAKQDA